MINSYDPISFDRNKYMEYAQKLFEPLIMPKKFGGTFCHDGPEGSDCWVFPTFQAKQLGITHDSETVLKLLKDTFQHDSYLAVSTGYFNLAKEVQDGLRGARSEMTGNLLERPSPKKPQKGPPKNLPI